MEEEPAGAAEGWGLHQVGGVVVHRMELTMAGAYGSAFRWQNVQAAIAVLTVEPLARINNPRAVGQPRRRAIISQIEGQPAWQQIGKGWRR